MATATVRRHRRGNGSRPIKRDPDSSLTEPFEQEGHDEQDAPSTFNYDVISTLNNTSRISRQERSDARKSHSHFFIINFFQTDLTLSKLRYSLLTRTKHRLVSVARRLALYFEKLEVVPL